MINGRKGTSSSQMGDLRGDRKRCVRRPIHNALFRRTDICGTGAGAGATQDAHASRPGFASRKTSYERQGWQASHSEQRRPNLASEMQANMLEALLLCL